MSSVNESMLAARSCRSLPNQVMIIDLYIPGSRSRAGESEVLHQQSEGSLTLIQPGFTPQAMLIHRSDLQPQCQRTR